MNAGTAFNEALNQHQLILNENLFHTLRNRAVEQTLTIAIYSSVPQSGVSMLDQLRKTFL